MRFAAPNERGSISCNNHNAIREHARVNSMDLTMLFWGAVTRMGQACIAASPTILVGWLVAAVFERILGREGTYRLFGGNTWRQLPQAWLLGMLLPVCSLGVIPVMVQMRRSGISGGTILAFGLTAPLFNPISVLYGLTLSDPWAILAFSLCSLVLITIMGMLWDRFFPNSQLPPEPLPKTPYGIRRIAAVTLSMCDQAFSAASLYMLVAIAGVGLLAAMLPAGVLQRAANQNDLLAPCTMALVSTLAYVTPMTAIVQVASMFQHGNSIAASFTLLALGTGVNLGMLMWMVVHYRWRPTLCWLGCLIAIVLAMSYGIDRPLQPKGIEPADHTHAFDIYCNPFTTSESNFGESSWRILRESVHPEEIVSMVAIAVLLAAGAILRLSGLLPRWMDRLHTWPMLERNSKDIVLPNSVIAAVCFVGLIASSIGACFLYYPPIDEVRKEMQAIEAEMLGSYHRGEWEKLEYWIPIQEDWGHKLTVGATLRQRPLDRYQQLKLQVYMNKLELLEHAVEDRDRDEASEFGQQAAQAFRRFKDALAR